MDLLERNINTKSMSTQQWVRGQTLTGSFRIDIDLHIIDRKQVFYRIVEPYVLYTYATQ